MKGTTKPLQKTEKPDLEALAKRNPHVDLELLRKAQAGMEQLIDQPKQFDIAPPFGRGRGLREIAWTKVPEDV